MLEGNINGPYFGPKLATHQNISKQQPLTWLKIGCNGR